MEYLYDSMTSLTILDSSTLCGLAVHAATFPIAIWFYTYRPAAKSALSRENVSAAIGVILVILAYGWCCIDYHKHLPWFLYPNAINEEQEKKTPCYFSASKNHFQDSLQLFIHWMLAYILLISVPKHQLGKYTFMMTMCHILSNHLYNTIYHYGRVTAIDYTGTMMLCTMKLSSIAFAVEDSLKPSDKLTQLQQKYKLQHVLTLHQHFTYTFSFVGILFGPVVFYNDYKQFMQVKTKGDKSTYGLAFKTLLGGLLAVTLYMLCVPQYDVKRNYDPEVLASGFLYRHLVLYISMFAAKCKYYFVWLTAQSSCLFAGLGEEDPSITATVNPLQIELATSLKQFVDNWNIFSGKWLRYSVYERVPRLKALYTFVVSAIWHGFYPGYLMMFLPLAFCTVLGRKLHKVVRPKFQSSTSLKVFYAIITWVGTAILIMFNGTGFQLLFFDKISQVQLGLYCYPHIVAVLLFICVPSPTRPPKPTANTNGDTANGDPHKPHVD